MPKVSAKYPVYRHGSDDVARDCGRACAQMVIASLVLGKEHAALNTLLPESQQFIRSREPYPSGPGRWYTFPDELAEVLNGSAGLIGLAQNNWRVVAHKPTNATAAGQRAARTKLLADIVAGLVLGMPSILNIKSIDHWVVVTEARLNASNGVHAIKYVDPAGLDTGVGAGRHTYKDDCENEGSDYWVTSTPIELAQLDLEVGNEPPLKYQGKYVAVVPGVGAQQAAAVTQETGPVPDIVTGLTEDATTLDLNDLGALLAANPQAVTRTVQDIEPTGDSFLLGSLFDFASGNGLIGCFNPATKRVSRFRLTRRVELHRYLNAVPPGESLFWTRKRLTTWSLPYYPYRQISPGQFRRLVGGIPLEYM